ncbi:MAG: sulfate reduction electron transfer complex DsrMKJOP subunit DsrJ [Planctomycetota bacterium]|jgi:hypothetical protein
MNDRRKIIAGLVIAIVVFTIPFWYGLFTLAAGNRVGPPDFDLPTGKCVEPDMRARHMDILEGWREAVVRGDGKKEYYKSSAGKEFEMSLTKTCLLQCHAGGGGEPASPSPDAAASAQQAFCQKCHQYADVWPDCWDCHVGGK